MSVYRTIGPLVFTGTFKFQLRGNSESSGVINITCNLLQLKCIFHVRLNNKLLTVY